MRPVSLKIKYIGGICALILFVSLTLLLYMRMEFDKRLEKELHKRGVSLARDLAGDAIKPLITENSVGLQLLLNDEKKNEEDVRYIYIINNQQQIISHTFGRSFPNDLLKLDRPDMDNQKPLIQELQSDQESLIDVCVPIQRGDFGRLHLGISEEVFKTERREMLQHMVPFIGLILLLSSAGAWWVASRITRPIIALSNSVKMVAEGRLDGVIAVTSHDEIGGLSAAFNAMTADLKLWIERQHQAEDELRMQAAILEEEIAERQMAQEELSVKQCQLEALNQSLEDRVIKGLDELRKKDRVMLAQGRQAAMGEMINNIAHQWRQPLNNLGLIVQNIKADYDHGALTPDVLSADVGKIMNTIMFMSQTINDFSSFFSQDTAKKVFVISHSLSKVTAMIEASLSKLNIQLVVEQQEEGIAVEGYFNEYSQVLLNLLNNAKDALLENSVQQPVIKVSIAREEDLAIVRVWDNAGGISDDIIGRIFDPYFTTKEHGKGSGVGLYMSKTIVEEHLNGTLTAANVAGGAQFTIATPLARDVA